MVFRTTHASVFAAVCAVLIPAGVGLTAPLWLAFEGLPLHVANRIGVEIVEGTTVVVAVFACLWWFVLRPRIEFIHPVATEDDGEADPAAPMSAKDRLVHAIVWALFVVPFILIIIGLIKGQIEKMAID